MQILRQIAGGLAAVGCLALVGTAAASSLPIRDQAKLFSRAALSEAGDALQGIREQFDKSLVIETYPSVSWISRLTHNLKGTQARENFFADWAKRNAKRAGSSAIYVLICKAPAPIHIEVVVGRDVAPYFSPKDSAQLHDLLQSRFREGQYDGGLLSSIRFVQSTLQLNGAPPPVAQEPFPWAMIDWLLLALAALWGLLELIQCMTSRQWSPAHARLEPLFFAGAGSLPAGLFRTATSSWLADLRRHRASTSMPPPVFDAAARQAEVAHQPTSEEGGHQDEVVVRSPALDSLPPSYDTSSRP
jgi:hypothetical protein